MNKRIIAFLVAVMLFIVTAIAITGCNKDKNEEVTTNPTTEEIQSNVEESTEENVSDEIVNDDKGENKTEKPVGNESETDAKEPETQKNEPSTDKAEPTTSKNEPTSKPKYETCEVCGGLIVSESDKDIPIVGKYCDGACDEWFG